MEVGGQLHAPIALPPGARAPGTHWIGGRVVHRTDMDTAANRKTFLSCRESNSGRAARSL